MAHRCAYSTQLCGWVPRALGTPPRFICRTNSVDKVHAQLVGLVPNFIRVKIPKSWRVAHRPDAFPPALLHQVHHLNATQLSTLSTSSYHSKTSAFVWFASFQISLFWVSTDSYLQSCDLVCIRKLPLCAGVSDPTIESEVDTFDQRRFGAPHRSFVRSWS
jgi:hypothetical protein